MTVARPFFCAFLTSLAASMLAMAAHATDFAWMLDRLISMLACNKSGRATSAEAGTLPVAAQPIESSGEPMFTTLGHLEEHTLAPKPGHLVVDGDKLTMERDQRKFTMPLSQYPELGVFIESIRATLIGNRYIPEAVYKVAVVNHSNDWMLALPSINTRMQ